MEIETKVISTEIIKPSSPTPSSLQRHQLSFLDQLSPPFFMPLVYFYSSSPQIPNPHKSQILKKSLSETLSRFYPLAGKLVDNLYVDCDDNGALFSEAEANCDLSHVITHPNPNHMNIFLPFKLNETQDSFCMAVRATYFRCGGVAVGLLISHKIADALSFFFFANSWSAAARNGSGGPAPIFDAAVHFPPQDISVYYKPSSGMVMKEELSTKIFKFPAEKIALLRERYGGCGVAQQRRPTRVEALSAFIWTRFISAISGMKSDPDKIYTVQHAVNLRTRTDPPLSEYHFGNISRTAIAEPAVGEYGGGELLDTMREAIKGVNGGYVAQLKEGGKHLNLLKERMAQNDKGELVSFSFTSLCRFPVKEADFGWGKPVWVGSAPFGYKNLVSFMDSSVDGDDGIEAWINLRKEDMEKFEADLELQHILSLTTSVDNP